VNHTIQRANDSLRATFSSAKRMSVRHGAYENAPAGDRTGNRQVHFGAGGRGGKDGLIGYNLATT
jgi:hypothetical protein